MHNVDKNMNYETLNLNVHIENLFVTMSFRVTSDPYFFGMFYK
jgi:hypothetical protein